MLTLIKRFILGICVISLWVITTSNLALADNSENTTMGFGSMFGVKWVKTLWTQKKQGDSLIHTIQTAINWVLWILATISLCLVLYAGFLMLTSWWDSKKYDSWLSIIKNAAIWLAIIATSWLIVSLIFYLINGSVNPNINVTEWGGN
jgi:L-cystine uptake protein TcyP (sodium:dicarboxylate symporter family)